MDRRPLGTGETRRRDQNVRHRRPYYHRRHLFEHRDFTTNRQNYDGGGPSRSQRHGGWGSPPSNPMHGGGSAPSMQARPPIPPHSRASAQDQELQRQYNAKIKVVHWTEALRLLEEIRQKGFPPNLAVPSASAPRAGSGSARSICSRRCSRAAWRPTSSRAAASLTRVPRAVTRGPRSICSMR